MILLMEKNTKNCGSPLGMVLKPCKTWGETTNLNWLAPDFFHHQHNVFFNSPPGPNKNLGEMIPKDLFLCTLLLISTESQLIFEPHFWACVLGSIVLRKCGDPAVELESHHVTMAFVFLNIATVLAGGRA